MKKNKITIAAGALLLAGVTTVNAVMLHNTSERYKLINFYQDNLEFTTFADEIHSNVTFQIEQVIDEEGRVCYKLPSGFQPYYVNSECAKVDFMKKESKDGYTYFYPVPYNLDLVGYIGVNDHYVNVLSSWEHMVHDIESKIYEKSSPLEKSGDLYYVPKTEVLYTLNPEFRNLEKSGVVQTDIEYYSIPNEIVENYVTVPKIIYENLIKAEALYEVIRGDYYEQYDSTKNTVRL